MTEYELVQSLFSGIETFDSGFEFWLTGTFAVIVACHLGQDITFETWLVSGNVVLASITFTAGFFGTLFFVLRTLRQK